MLSASRRLGQHGRFELLRKLGEGGMGTVYEALDQERGESVALKLVGTHGAMALQRFKHEFRALQDLAHPNLVRLGELHEADGDWFITMELVPGSDLLSYVCEEDGGYDEPLLRASFQQLALGLRALHVAGKVHRDIKPSNVRVTPEGRVVILDFGLVIDRAAARMSIEGDVVGTVAYMAPEQASAASIDASADWYAFGTVLYEALTGTVPFTGNKLQVLMDKLRITPAPPRARLAHVPEDLDELCVELLRSDPSTRPRGEEVLRRLGVSAEPSTAAAITSTGSLQSGTGTFVGRSNEFDLLMAAFAEVQQGASLTVSVEGPSGIGKSALVSRFTQQVAAATSDAMILHGRCYERETARFKALDGVIDALATTLAKLSKAERQRLLPRNAALLRQLFPVLGRVDAIGRAARPPVSPHDAVEERRLMFASLRELLARLGELRPLVLVIDDMHWSDGDSLELLRTLLDGSHESPPRLLLLVTARVPWLAVAGLGTPQPWPVKLRTVALEPLTAEDATLLACELLERRGNPGLDVQALVRESRGHPLFVAELARHAATLPGESAVPLTLDGAIRERACALPEPALRVLRTLAVAALPLPLHILELATHLAPSALERQLGMLRLGAFVRSATGRDQRRIEPFHDRVREAVLDQLEAEQRRELHGTLAALLEQEPNVDLELVAQHYLDAGDREKACSLFERAARRAEEGFAFERAALLYRLQLTLRPHSPAEQSELHTKVGSALARAGQGRAAADAYGLASDGADNLARVNLRHLRAMHLLRSGYLTEGLSALDDVLRSVGLGATRSRVRAAFAYLWERLRRHITGYRVIVRDPSTVAPQVLARADALLSVSQGLVWVDGMLAAPLIMTSVRLALATGERTRMIRALGGEAMFTSLLGPRTARPVGKLLNLMRETAAPERSPEMRAFVAMAECCVASGMGELRRLYDKSGEALALYEQSGADVQWEHATVRVFRMYGQLYVGRLRDAMHESWEAAADADARKDRWLASILRVNIAAWRALSSDAGDVAAARAVVDEAYRPWRTRKAGFMHSIWVLSSMLLDLFEQRGDEALRRFAVEHAALRHGGALQMEITLRHLQFYLGIAHLQAHRAGQGCESLAHAQRKAKGLRSGAPFFRGVADLLDAQVSLARGRDAEALELVRRARTRFAVDGAATYEQLAQALEGSIVGGEAGTALVDGARQHFRGEGIANPEQLLSALLPVASGARA